MTALTTIDRVLNTMQRGGSTSNRDSVKAALDQISPLAENIIGTPLDLRDWTDVWAVDVGWAKSQDRLGFVRFQLSAGFVSCDFPVRVDYVPDVMDYLQEGSQVTPTVLEKGSYFPALEEGNVRIRPVSYTSAYRVRYTAGFQVQDSVYQLVPEWLQAAAVSAAIEYLQVFQQKWNPKDFQDTSSAMYRMVQSHVTSHIRPTYGEPPFDSSFYSLLTTEAA